MGGTSGTGGEGGGAATLAPPAAKSDGPARRGRKPSRANNKMRELLTDDPDMAAVDVMTILLHDHFITADQRQNAERAYYKIRTKIREDAGLPPVQPPAAKPAGTPPATGSFERATGVAMAAAKQGVDADRDRFTGLMLTKRAMIELPGLDPAAALRRAADLSEQLGGPGAVREHLDALDALDAIRPALEAVQPAEPRPANAGDPVAAP